MTPDMCECGWCEDLREDWCGDPEDKPRCELDHRDGGVCLRVLRRDGTCPGERDHS